ncbi:DUF2790 domain-containing protein [Pseudomonas sp. NPDC090202]|uniref:DUF2790 domain-containing protein n=1 Tax=unclassified Pseudomonas TaxID=196821 RepID=UPI0037F9A332
MKYLAFAALSFASIYATASQAADVDAAAKPLSHVEQYNQHKGLDIAKVISVKSAQDPEKTDGPVRNTMVYVDGSGVTHSLEYTTQGYGRQNG